jgi:predicted component of type VI protein secretion system
MPESTQHKLDRVRPPRVQITYDVETRGSFVKMELPFVVGIMANLSTDGGQKDASGNPIPLRDKKYLEIDRDNFNDIMTNLKPSVELEGGGTYTFSSLDDFTPIKLLRPAATEADAAAPTSKLGIARVDYDKRTKLSDIMAKLDGNVPLQQKFIAALSDANRADSKAKVEAAKAEAQARLNPVVQDTKKVVETPADPGKPKKEDNKK